MIGKINELVWDNWLLISLLVSGLYLTVKIGFKQFRLGAILKGTVLSKGATQGGKDTLSPFQTMTTSLSATMGTGNIVGVASAIALGSSGAILWLWVSAVLGMALIYVENYLGTKYRTKLSDGTTVGGACAYLEYGLQCRPLAVVFALLCIGASFGMGNMAQANAISTALGATFAVPTWVTALATSTLVALIVVGGIQRVGQFTQCLIPLLSGAYVLGALVVILSNVERLPQVFRDIFSQAFGFNAVTGGFTGSMLRTAVNVGLRRGVFSNEAGLGSSSMLHTSVECQDPHTIGLWGMLETFIDTIVCCTLTALAILVTDVPTTLESTSLVIEAFKHGLGSFSGIYITLAIALFAFATLVGWSCCGEACSRYLFGEGGTVAYKVAFVGCVALGCVLNGNSVWTLSDVFNGLMAVPNLVGLVVLSFRDKDLRNAH